MKSKTAIIAYVLVALFVCIGIAASDISRRNKLSKEETPSTMCIESTDSKLMACAIRIGRLEEDLSLLSLRVDSLEAATSNSARNCSSPLAKPSCSLAIDDLISNYERLN